MGFVEAIPSVNRCANHDRIQCNWQAQDGYTLCVSCGTNEIVPSIQSPEQMDNWSATEIAKKRMMWTLARLGLWPVQAPDTMPPLKFRLLSPQGDVPEDMDALTMGHKDGCITINIAEADPAILAQRQQDLDEAYRTLLGHFRHEIGHYYWIDLIDRQQHHSRFRAVFGDEREDYADALERHYARGAFCDWQETFISAYAASHAWEDWAETFAHLLHIFDLVETDLALMGLNGPITHWSFTALLERWYPLVERLNCYNRSLGQADAYPFALSGAVREKLSFIWRLITHKSPVQKQPMELS